MRTVLLYSGQVCLLILLCLVGENESRGQDGVGWVMAAYRVRKAYEYIGNQTAPNIHDLFAMLDLGTDTTLHEKDSLVSVQGDVVVRLEERHNNRAVKGSQLDVSVKSDGSIERVGGRVTQGLSKALRKYIRRNCKLFEKGSKIIAGEYEGFQSNQMEIERFSISKDLVVSDDGGAYITVTADITWVDPATDSGNVTRKIYTIDACKKTVMDTELHKADVFNADALKGPQEEPLDDLKVKEDFNFDKKITSIPSSEVKPEKRIPCDTPASGFGGNLKTGLIEYGIRPYCLDLRFVNGTCYLQNQYIKVVDMHNSVESDPDQVINFPCRHGYNDTTNGGFSVALDTFYHATQTIKMYKDWYEFQPIPDTRALVHFDRQVDNAYWDGRTLIVGDGGRADTFPFSTLDTVAHEISHGVTEHTSGLQYSGESGAINEAFSDIAGEAVEVFVRGQNDWVVGADVTKADGRGIRYFDDPTRDGISIGHVTDFQTGMDVHRSSGIINKAFYVVAQTLGVRDAFRAFVVANRLYWRQKSSFDEAACDVIKASYDVGSPMEAYVSAFDAVGIKMAQCQDLNKFIVIVHSNETRDQVFVSKTVQPLFIVKTPESAISMEIDVSGDNHIVIKLTKSFLRNEYETLMRVSGSSLKYEFTEETAHPLYLRLVGNSDNVEIISMNIKFF